MQWAVRRAAGFRVSGNLCVSSNLKPEWTDDPKSGSQQQDVRKLQQYYTNKIKNVRIKLPSIVYPQYQDAGKAQMPLPRPLKRQTVNPEP